MSSCRICKEVILDGIHLSDGGMIHESCLARIQSKKNEIKNEVHLQLQKFELFKHEIGRRNRLGYKLLSVFSKTEDSNAEIERKLQTTDRYLRQLSNILVSLRNDLSSLYDYFLTYPPDWEERKKQVIERDGERCNECLERGHLHLDHIEPLSKGGSNKLINLQLLCENCHSKKHGGRDFSGEFNITETAFSKRQAAIQYAINNGKRIKFGYKKPNDVSYKQRIVKPFEILDIKHQRDDGLTLCVRGYCDLRKEERTFALKRMRGLKVI